MNEKVKCTLDTQQCTYNLHVLVPIPIYGGYKLIKIQLKFTLQITNAKHKKNTELLAIEQRKSQENT